MSYSIVLGNGYSRKSVPPRVLKNKNTFACNYAYRDYEIKNLICCDKHMLISAIAEGAAMKSKIWTRDRWYNNIEPKNNINVFPKLPFIINEKYDQPMNWGSGTYAAYLACLDEPNIMVFAGFDLWDKDGKINSVYAGQEGYADTDSGAVNPSVWIYQFAKLFEYFHDKQFVFVNFPDWQEPEEWKKFPNFYKDNLKVLNTL